MMRDGAVADAMAEAKRCHDWVTIAESLPPEVEVHAVATPLLETAVAEHEIWGIRHAARILAERGDPDGSRAALEAGYEMLLRDRGGEVRRRTRGYAWVIVGRGGDTEFLRRCLEAGVAHTRESREAGDLIDVAKAWWDEIDRPTGIALLREAETLDDARPWTVANAWSHVGERDEVRRVLDAALAAATEIDDAIHVARAWGSHAAEARRLAPEHVDELMTHVHAALDRAEMLASGTNAWLQLAETAFDIQANPAYIRRALDYAAALGEAPARVSAGYKQWLGDESMAAKLGPRGVVPSALHPMLRAAPIPGDAEALFTALRARITPAQLATIARADYGMDFAKHLAALEDICATGLVPEPLPWEPHEVCALTRWDEGVRVDHVIRALCSLLIIYSDGELVTNGPILLESCRMIELDAKPFFAWCYETTDYEEAIVQALLFLSGVPAPLDLDKLEHDLADSMRVHLWRELFITSGSADLALLAEVLA